MINPQLVGFFPNLCEKIDASHRRTGTDGTSARGEQRGAPPCQGPCARRSPRETKIGRRSICAPHAGRRGTASKHALQRLASESVLFSSSWRRHLGLRGRNCGRSDRTRPRERRIRSGGIKRAEHIPYGHTRRKGQHRG